MLWWMLIVIPTTRQEVYQELKVPQMSTVSSSSIFLLTFMPFPTWKDLVLLRLSEYQRAQSADQLMSENTSHWSCHPSEMASALMLLATLSSCTCRLNHCEHAPGTETAKTIRVRGKIYLWIDHDIGTRELWLVNSGWRFSQQTVGFSSCCSLVSCLKSYIFV